jgi:cyclophilin family peptidyl-prolyl cis-trans isomerase
MIRQIPQIFSCLLAGASLATADVLVNVRAHDPKIIDPAETHSIDLGDYFQTYAEPGPVATFSLYMPVQTGYQQLLYKTTNDYQPDYNPEGPTLEFMTYELASGGTYDHIYDPAAASDNFFWRPESVNVQLLADTAPIAVSNFVQYVNEVAYDNTIIHRSEPINPLADTRVLQMGRYRISPDDTYLLEAITRRDPILWEESIPNARGTLGMARSTGLNTASSEFFINLGDNSDTLGIAYTVFGKVTEPETSLPLLDEMGQADVWNLRQFLGDIFVTTPLYSPISPWDVNLKTNFLRIPEVSVPEGTRTGVTYSWEFADMDGVEGTSETEAANQAAFNVTLSGGQLSVSRSDSGKARVVVTGTAGEDSLSFNLDLAGYNSQALDAFPSSTIEQGGYLDNAWYGRMQAETYPAILHDNHGAQWVTKVVDEETGVQSFYIYDAKLHSWLYTRPSLYPLIYVYEWGTYVQYVTDTGNGMNFPRWFYNYSTSEWVTD